MAQAAAKEKRARKGGAVPLPAFFLLVSIAASSFFFAFSCRPHSAFS